MQLVLWRMRRGGLRAAMRLLSAIVVRAEQADDTIVVSSPLAARREQEQLGLERASRLLGFHPRAFASSMYVYSSDAWFWDPAHVRFNPFFHAVF